jgi:ketosteroid isomerase-like protein
MRSDALAVLEAFENSLFAGEDVRPFFSEDAVYEVTGQPPLGGRFEGREAIASSFDQRLTGLGPGMEGEDVERVKYATSDGSRAVAEIHERSWLPQLRDDLLEVRTCSVAHVEDGLITRLIDYTDSAAYEAFLARHRDRLPKFSGASR